jgi:preprotein translocase subunit YajC
MVILAYFAVIALAFFILIVRPQRRRLTAHRNFVSRLQVGDDVVTTGGIFATVRDLGDDRVILEVAPGVLITVARAAVAQSAGPLPAADDARALDAPDPSTERPSDRAATDDPATDD